MRAWALEAALISSGGGGWLDSSPLLGPLFVITMFALAATTYGVESRRLLPDDPLGVQVGAAAGPYVLTGLIFLPFSWSWTGGPGLHDLFLTLYWPFEGPLGVA